MRRDSVWQGWREIVARIGAEVAGSSKNMAVELYPGVFEKEVLEALVDGLHPVHVFRTSDCWKEPPEIEAMVGTDLTDDPVFGRISQFTIDDFADPRRTAQLRENCRSAVGLTLVFGTGTALLAPEPDVLILADLARWEIQRRQLANQIGNFPAGDMGESPTAKYKRAFFVDWRVADRRKQPLIDRIELPRRLLCQRRQEDTASGLRRGG